MGTIYLTEQNSYLRKKSKRYIIEKDGETLLEIPAFKVDQIFIFGNVQISTQAFSSLLYEGIDTTFFTQNGRYKGRLISSESKNIILRLEQYRAFHNSQFRLDFSKVLVSSKLTNGRRLLQKISYGKEADVQENLNSMSQMIDASHKADCLESLRGFEGRGTAFYFAGLSKLMTGLPFHGRNRNPPKDPVNSLLSYGYTLLTSEVFSAVIARGLDPYLGFYHEVKYGRTALCFDLCEEFRHLVVDGLVLDLVNRRRIKEEDFQEDEEYDGLLMSQEAKKIYLKSFAQKMIEERKHSNEKKLSYRNAIHQQVQFVQDAIMKQKPYQAFHYG